MYLNYNLNLVENIKVLKRYNTLYLGQIELCSTTDKNVRCYLSLDKKHLVIVANVFYNLNRWLVSHL